MRLLKKTFASLAATIMIGTSVPASAAQDLLIGGGSASGVYYQAALQLCNVINRHSAGKYNCIGRPALGSAFNINAVNQGLLDFGVAQSDSNWQSYTGNADWKGKPIVNLRSVFSMHPEAVLLISRKDTRIASIDDLKGKRVNIGNPGSGHRGNAEDVLRIHRIHPARDLQAGGLQQHDASRALVDRTIDALFYTVGNPNAAIEELANSTHISLIPINSRALKKFIADKPYYVTTTIPAGTYKGVDQPTETYAVKATIVASADASEQMIYDVVKIVFEHLDELRNAHTAFKDLTSEEMLRGLSAPFHPGALEYYKERGWKIPETLAAQ
ncbi:MAG: TAXI family TRAP transporter solute-binding subunit [Gammaproteobacteria bacterium]|nr:TAXI family TRAP transporter solute-binding subunit [Gammaproteobacteria bacterium]